MPRSFFLMSACVRRNDERRTRIERDASDDRLGRSLGDDDACDGELEIGMRGLLAPSLPETQRTPSKDTPIVVASAVSVHRPFWKSRMLRRRIAASCSSLLRTPPPRVNSLRVMRFLPPTSRFRSYLSAGPRTAGTRTRRRRTSVRRRLSSAGRRSAWRRRVALDVHELA